MIICVWLYIVQSQGTCIYYCHRKHVLHGLRVGIHVSLIDTNINPCHTKSIFLEFVMPPPGMGVWRRHLVLPLSVPSVRPFLCSFVSPNILLIEITQKVFDYGYSHFHLRCISIWPWRSSTISDLDLFFKVTRQFKDSSTFVCHQDYWKSF